MGFSNTLEENNGAPKEETSVSRQKETVASSICFHLHIQFQLLVKRLCNFKSFFDYLFGFFFSFLCFKQYFIRTTLFIFWKKTQNASSSHSGSAGDDWEKKSCKIGLCNVHDILHGTPWLFACSGFIGPNRCYWPPLQGGASAAFLVQKKDLAPCPGKPGEEYVTQVFPTDMQEIPHAWNRGDSGKICIWSRLYVRAHSLSSHRNWKHLKQILELAPQYSLLCHLPNLSTLITLKVKVGLQKVQTWVCHHRFTYTAQIEMGQLLYFLVIEQEIPCSLLPITWKRNVGWQAQK